jgi:hypothetical protein
VTVNPALPSGLSLNPSTGCITGTPTGSSVIGQYIFTATNSAGSDQDSIDITVNDVSPPSSLWTIETSTTTKDLKALHPTATGFEFKIVGAGGGGVGGYWRQINTQSAANSSAGSGGGYTTTIIPASSFTGPATLEVGLGGAGGGISINPAPAHGQAGKAGGTSAVKIGATVLADAKGGNFGSSGGAWPYGGVGLTLNGGSAANISGTSTVSPLHGLTSDSRTSGGATAPALATSLSTGSGGTFSGFTTSTAIRVSQKGQDASTGAIGGAAGTPNLNSVTLSAGGNGQDGVALTDGTLNFGAGGGGGGMGSNNNVLGGNGGNGGWPGGGGGSGGSSTLVRGSVGGAGANGVIMWRPIF